MSENIKGDLFIGAGVVAIGTLNAPGLIEVDGSVDGVVNARSINVTGNGVVTGNSTADHIRVAGKLMNTSTAHQSLLVESTGDVYKRQIPHYRYTMGAISTFRGIS